MAVWQVDFIVAPKKNIVSRKDVLNEENYVWYDLHIIEDGISRISDYYNKGKSWSRDISLYGEQDSTCIELFYDGDCCVEVRCRLDLRSLTKEELKKIIGFATSIQGVFIHENKVYDADLYNLVEVLKRTNEARFCNNPMKFLKGVKED